MDTLSAFLSTFWSKIVLLLKKGKMVHFWISALKLFEELKLLFEAVPALFVKHITLIILFLDPLAAVMDTTVDISHFRANRVLVPALLLDDLQIRHLTGIFWLRSWSFLDNFFGRRLCQCDDHFLLVVSLRASLTRVGRVGTVWWALVCWGNG